MLVNRILDLEVRTYRTTSTAVTVMTGLVEGIRRQERRRLYWFDNIMGHVDWYIS